MSQIYLLCPSSYFMWFRKRFLEILLNHSGMYWYIVGIIKGKLAHNLSEVILYVKLSDYDL